MKTFWGIDLGGTKVEGVVLQADNFKVLCRERIPTEQQFGYEHILGQIVKLIDILKQKTGLAPDGIGIGTPGTLDPRTNLLKNSNTVCLNGQPIKDDLEKMTSLPFRFMNDANCFALAETHMGAVPNLAPDAEVVFGVILGTGVGGGIVVDGKVIRGAMGIGGEWGHNVLDESGDPCYCGKTGCVETIISGTGLQKYYKSVSGTERKLKEIVERHKSGTDEHATATVQRLLKFYGKAIASIINVLDPDVILLGGGVGNIDMLYTEGRGYIMDYLFNDRLETIIAKPKLGDSAGVFGAALLMK